MAPFFSNSPQTRRVNIRYQRFSNQLPILFFTGDNIQLAADSTVRVYLAR